MPYKNLISEVLSAHADQILKNRDYEESYATLFPDDQNLPPLLNLAHQVKEAMQPVQASNSFKEQLQRDLMAAAHLKEEDQQDGVSLLILLSLSALVALMGLMFLLRRQQNSVLD